MIKEVYKNVEAVSAQNGDEWRYWLHQNYERANGVWLIIYKKSSGIQSIYYPEAVDHALCFGWIDSKPNKRDQDSFYQYFSKRNPKSNWSKINKEKIHYLTEKKLMTEPGLKMVQLARQNGTWDALNDVDNLVVPDDLAQLFEKNTQAFKIGHSFRIQLNEVFWNGYSMPSDLLPDLKEYRKQ